MTIARGGTTEEDLKAQARWHALPDGWTSLPYDEFLAQRRKLMAAVVRSAFAQLADQQYAPQYPPPGRPAPAVSPARASYAVRVSDLLDAGLLTTGSVLINQTDEVEATVLADGRLQFDETGYDSPSGAGDAAHGGGVNGWTYWLADTREGLRPLADLREELLRGDEREPS